VNISLSEILLVLIVALVVIKPEQLPEVAFKLGQWTKQFRKGMNKLRQEFDGTVTQLGEEVKLKALPEKTELTHETRKS
jgi:Tat protein translocase TatB subunit